MISHLGSGVGSFLSSLTSLSGIRENVLMGTGISSLENVVVGILGIVFLEAVDYLRAHGVLHQAHDRIPPTVRIVLYNVFVFCILIFGQFSTALPFIYFQF